MNWYQNIWWEIKYFLKYNWLSILIIIGLGIIVSFGAWKINEIPRDVLFPPKVEQIVNIIEVNLQVLEQPDLLTYMIQN